MSGLARKAWIGLGKVVACGGDTKLQKKETIYDDMGR